MEVKARPGQDSDKELLRRGPWSVEEDLKLINSIATHGEGRWNLLARNAGLKRTGKSCRLRWLNYLRPDVRRGNITLEEQLLILELHSRFGNRWSKIAQYLRGRTDNEIKNYWRTRVQKQAKQLRCDVNSKQFKDTMKYLWMPRLVERIQAASSAASSASIPAATIPGATSLTDCQLNKFDLDLLETDQSLIPNPAPKIHCSGADHPNMCPKAPTGYYNSKSCESESTSAAAASVDSAAMQVSPASDLTTDYCNIPAICGNPTLEAGYVGGPESNYEESLLSYDPFSGFGYYNHGLGYPGVGQSDPWLNGANASESLWNNADDELWFLQDQLNSISSMS